jgi:hypothetical protein
LVARIDDDGSLDISFEEWRDYLMFHPRSDPGLRIRIRDPVLFDPLIRIRDTGWKNPVLGSGTNILAHIFRLINIFL